MQDSQEVVVFKIMHPDFQLTPQLNPILNDAWNKQDPAIFMDAVMAHEPKIKSRFVRGGKAQFQVLKKAFSSKNAFLFEGLDPLTFREFILRSGPRLHQIFPRQQLPESFSELSGFQQIAFMTIALPHIAAVITPSKLICSTMLGSPQENKIHAAEAEFSANINNDFDLRAIKDLEHRHEMDIIHAISVCISTKSGMGTNLVIGAMHDTSYLSCFIDKPYTEFFYPSKQYLQYLVNQRGKSIPENKILSPTQCKKDIASFLEKYPSYRRFVSFCTNNISTDEAQTIKNEYRAACHLHQTQDSSFSANSEIKDYCDSSTSQCGNAPQMSNGFGSFDAFFSRGRSDLSPPSQEYWQDRSVDTRGRSVWEATFGFQAIETVNYPIKAMFRIGGRLTNLISDKITALSSLWSANADEILPIVKESAAAMTDGMTQGSMRGVANTVGYAFDKWNFPRWVSRSANDAAYYWMVFMLNFHKHYGDLTKQPLYEEFSIPQDYTMSGEAAYEESKMAQAAHLALVDTYNLMLQQKGIKGFVELTALLGKQAVAHGWERIGAVLDSIGKFGKACSTSLPLIQNVWNRGIVYTALFGAADVAAEKVVYGLGRRGVDTFFKEASEPDNQTQTNINPKPHK